MAQKTPMMQQYDDAKQACGDALLLFRMGDFYELFFEDAKVAAEAVGLTLTSRDKSSDNPVAMAGFPHHQLEGYLAKLIRQGFRVAICEQVEDPKAAKGLVKREVTRVVSAGTLTDDALLDPRQSNYLAAVVAANPNKRNANSKATKPTVGIAWVELSTGRFHASEFYAERLVDELSRIQPAECLVDGDQHLLPEYVKESMLVTERPSWEFAFEASYKGLCKHFATHSLSGFGFNDDDVLAIRAAGAVLAYLNETQRASIDHIDRLIPYRPGARLEIDEATRRSLEITRTMRDGRREGSLLAVLDRTVTAMGSRLLADWVANPLTDISEIDARLDAISELLAEAALSSDLRVELKNVYDMERLLARVTTGRATPRDLSYIATTLGGLPRIKAKLTARKSERLKLLEAELDLCPDVRSKLDAALSAECPLTSREGGFIKPGFHAELDQLRELAAGGKEWIAKYQAEECERIGVANLKVGFNKVFGYYLEITNANKDKAPDYYIRKQTLKNAERYITPELKEYEEKVLSADEKAKQLEYDLFLELRDLVQASGRRLQATAHVLAQIDVLSALTELARQRNYCRPQLVDRIDTRIVDGRHPILDVTTPEGEFVANDTIADESSGFLLLITGPNMAGKSTYIRQVALITLMAQMGSYVPAGQATIGVADRIFARVGASDELSRGQSTFMVEMTETARILNTATSKSLVILDEIGRGTSTYDGVSLAWAIVEHLHDQIGCRTLFATHYHELTELEQSLDGMKNLNVVVQEWDDKIVFLHRIVDGSTNKSYGIHVARLAGVPNQVNDRAKEILAQLEKDHLQGSVARPNPTSVPPKPRQELQLTLFGPAEHPLLDVVRNMDVQETSPMDALLQIKQWQDELARESQPKPR